MLTTKKKSGHAQDNNRGKEISGHGHMPKENPGKSTSKQEIIYPRESEAGSQKEGADASFTERNDVTPPNKKEFPSVGPAKTDFEARKLGRTTGRMIGHEPGTESI